MSIVVRSVKLDSVKDKLVSICRSHDYQNPRVDQDGDDVVLRTGWRSILESVKAAFPNNGVELTPLSKEAAMTISRDAAEKGLRLFKEHEGESIMSAEEKTALFAFTAPLKFSNGDQAPDVLKNSIRKITIAKDAKFRILVKNNAYEPVTSVLERREVIDAKGTVITTDIAKVVRIRRPADPEEPPYLNFRYHVLIPGNTVQTVYDDFMKNPELIPGCCPRIKFINPEKMKKIGARNTNAAKRRVATTKHRPGDPTADRKKDVSKGKRDSKSKSSDGASKRKADKPAKHPCTIKISSFPPGITFENIISALTTQSPDAKRMISESKTRTSKDGTSASIFCSEENFASLKGIFEALTINGSKLEIETKKD